MTEKSKEKSRMLMKFLRILKLKQFSDPNLTINALGFKAYNINPTYSASYYHKVMQGQRSGAKAIWFTIFEALELTPLEWFLVNQSPLQHAVELDMQKYGTDQVVQAYITELNGTNIVYNYERIDDSENKEQLNTISVNAYMKVPLRLRDVYVLLINQSRELFIVDLYPRDDLPQDIKDYIANQQKNWANID